MGLTKTCGTCKHWDKPINEEPCAECERRELQHGPYTLFEPAEPVEADPVVDVYDIVNRQKLYCRADETTMKVDTTEENDVINRPSHYCRDGAMETIDEMELVFGKEAVAHFCLCNAWKYRARAMYKNGEEDLKKSDWYMRRYEKLKKELENE